MSGENFSIIVCAQIYMCINNKAHDIIYFTHFTILFRGY